MACGEALLFSAPKIECSTLRCARRQVGEVTQIETEARRLSRGKRAFAYDPAPPRRPRPLLAVPSHVLISEPSELTRETSRDTKDNRAIAWLTAPLYAEIARQWEPYLRRAREDHATATLLRQRYEHHRRDHHHGRCGVSGDQRGLLAGYAGGA
jgi:hypothetical protein